MCGSRRSSARHRRDPEVPLVTSQPVHRTPLEGTSPGSVVARLRPVCCLGCDRRRLSYASVVGLADRVVAILGVNTSVLTPAVLHAAMRPNLSDSCKALRGPLGLVTDGWALGSDLAARMCGSDKRLGHRELVPRSAPASPELATTGSDEPSRTAETERLMETRRYSSPRIPTFCGSFSPQVGRTVLA